MQILLGSYEVTEVAGRGPARNAASRATQESSSAPKEADAAFKIPFARRSSFTSRSSSVGLERTGRIVTAAALLLSVAMGAFTTSRLVFIKELGFGTALAVLVDASIIRGLLSRS